MFASGIEKYSAKELVQILLEKRLHQGYVSQQQPLRVKESKVFIVDTDNLSHPDDIKADELGGWKNDGQHSRWLKVELHQNEVTSIKFCGGKPSSDSHIYCLHRAYFVHRSNCHFKRKIAYLSGNISCTYIIVHYVIVATLVPMYMYVCMYKWSMILGFI